MKKFLKCMAIASAMLFFTSCNYFYIVLPDDFYDPSIYESWEWPGELPGFNGGNSSSQTPGDLGDSSGDSTIITPMPPVEAGDLTFTTTAFSNSLKKDGPLTQDSLPSTGSPKILVIPVNLNSSKKTDKLLKDIQTTFSGTGKETGWESVESYYEKSSYGKLHLDCVVMQEWFTPARSARYYEEYWDPYTGEEGSSLLVKEALAYYESKLDLSEYDYDKDGYMDSVWLVYNHAVDRSINADFYWAYTTDVYDERTYDGVKARSYAFAGTDFMYDSISYDPDSPVKLDAHVFIHETGHLMGLDDYYDYDWTTGAEGGMHNADMMDGMIGDHGVISKMLLGWVTPTIVTGKGVGSYMLSSFTKSGQFLLISDHTLTSIYDEYFLVEFYTNDGLNEWDHPILDDYFEVAEGIRIMHVDARFNYDKNGKVVWNEGTYYTGFRYDNSDTEKLFVEHLRADGKNLQGYLYPECLYTANGKVFGGDHWSKSTYNSGSSLNFLLEVLAVQNGQCAVEITLR